MVDDLLPKPQKCLNCGTAIEMATAIKGEGAPNVGDVSVCLYCGHLMEFGPGLVLMPPRDQTIIDHAGDKDLLLAMKIVGLYRRKNS